MAKDVLLLVGNERAIGLGLMSNYHTLYTDLPKYGWVLFLVKVRER